MIQRLMFRHGMTGRRPIWSGAVPRQPDAEWTLHEAAERLGIHRHTAYYWLRVGRLRGQLAAHGGQRIWLVTMTGGRTRITSGLNAKPGPHQVPSIERLHGNAIEQAFAKLKALFRKGAARIREALWTTIGSLLDTFTPAECRNYLAHSGYALE